MLGTVAALEMAHKLEDMLAILTAGAPPSERFELRLAEALAGNLADHLETLAEHGPPSSAEPDIERDLSYG